MSPVTTGKCSTKPSALLFFFFFFPPKRILMQMQGIRRLGAVRKRSAQSWQELAAKFRGVPTVPISPAPRRYCLNSLRAEFGVPQCCAGRDPEWGSGRILYQLKSEAECLKVLTTPQCRLRSERDIHILLNAIMSQRSDFSILNKS